MTLPERRRFLENRKGAVFSTFADSRTGNRGAVSMLESAIDHLTSDEHPGVMNVFTVYPRADRKLPPTPYVNLYNGTPWNLAFKLIPLCLIYRLLARLRIPVPRRVWGKEMTALFDTDVCLMIGGTTFSDAQVFKIPYNVACLLPAIILGKKSIMYSQTLGPFKATLNRICARWSFSKMDFIVPRGPSSLKNVQSLFPSNRVQYYADSAFSLIVPEEVESRIRQKYDPLLQGEKVVGLSVNSIVERKCRMLGIDHSGAWAQFIDHLHGRGYRVLLIPHSLREKGRTRHNNDLITISAIQKRLTSKKEVYVLDEPFDCKELRAVVGLARYFVASRFHAMISALCNVTPVSVFGWGFQKYREVLQEFELQDYCHDAAELSRETLISGFEAVVRDERLIKERIEKNLPKVRRSSAMNHETAWQLYLESISDQSSGEDIRLDR